MLGRNNHGELFRKCSDQKQRFAIRRVGLVTASVLIGLIFAGGVLCLRG
ncbi:YSIRK-type signal peptide-containing protein [Ligilactobacillus saerimneri]|nr:YSIRK-type signal peptide-containing protein [Ligilactobacillus saerimneri]